MYNDVKGKIKYNEGLIGRLITEGTPVVFTLNKHTTNKEIISWNTAPRFYPEDMKAASIRIGYMLDNARLVGLDDLAMPDQPTDEKLIEECHELTLEEILGYYKTDIAEREGSLWNVEKNYSAIFMRRETFEEVQKLTGREVSLVFPCADCAVARFYDPEHDVIGITHSDAIHTTREIIPKSVRFMQEHFGTDVSKLEVFVGAFASEGWTYDKLPAFSLEKDESGNTVGLNKVWQGYIVLDGDKYIINYGELIYDQIASTGVELENISFSPDNTLFNDNYFSNSRSFNSRVNGVATYREGRNLMGITFGKEKVLESKDAQNVIIR